MISLRLAAGASAAKQAAEKFIQWQGMEDPG